MHKWLLKAHVPTGDKTFTTEHTAPRTRALITTHKALKFMKDHIFVYP